MTEQRDSRQRVEDVVARAEKVLATRPDVSKLEANPVGRLALTGMIDHTLLKPEATPAMVEQLCAEAAEYHFASVCVNPVYVGRCAAALEGASVAVCSVAGFPLGTNVSEIKALEAARAIEDGATEIDIVMNVGALKAADYALVSDDIAAVARVCADGGAKLKVILETCLLDDLEKTVASLLAVEAGADYVKTSTGMNAGGATVEDVALMRHAVGPDIGVKAAGGIRTYEQAIAMVAAGATRLGASAGIAIVRGAHE
jgi:deoxyribose-phosphate aldolase